MASRALAPKQAPKWFVGKDPLGDGLVEDPPTRSKTGEFIFNDAPDFKPNLSPAEVLQAGSFGGGYFRDITSSVTKTTYKDAWTELPEDWLEGLDIKTQVASQTYRTSINRYGVNCGVKTDKSDSFGLKAWEASGWMAAQDPYGWFQWYCRFFQGRRSDDDERQLSRWMKCCGPKGRWKSNLIGKCLRDGKSYDDASVSPVVRQTLQHWGYRLTRAHFDAGSARVKAKGAAYLPRSQLQHVLDKPAAAAPKKAAPKKKARVVESDSESEEEDDESASEPELGSDDDDDDDVDEVMPQPRKRGAPRTRGDSDAAKKPAARKKRR